jgi:hypothetical protein
VALKLKTVQVAKPTGVLGILIPYAPIMLILEIMLKNIGRVQTIKRSVGAETSNCLFQGLLCQLRAKTLLSPVYFTGPVAII